jgi:hypothetical protein
MLSRIQAKNFRSGTHLLLDGSGRTTNMAKSSAISHAKTVK